MITDKYNDVLSIALGILIVLTIIYFMGHNINVVV